jgi:hypothetical protein
LPKYETALMMPRTALRPSAGKGSSGRKTIFSGRTATAAPSCVNLFEQDGAAVAVRPEKIVLRPDEPSSAGSANAVRGVISAVSYFGHETQYQVLLDSGMLLKAARFDDARLERGQRVLAMWDSGDARVLTA